MRQPHSADLPDAVDLLDAFAACVPTLGTPAFDAALLRAINALAEVDHLTVLTWNEADGLRALLVASRSQDGVARSLTRDFVATHHMFDPNFPELTRPNLSRTIIVRRHDPGLLRTRRYQRRFYGTVGIVDKLSYLWSTGDEAFYVNLYRTLRSGRYAQRELASLTIASRFLASLIQLHGGRTRLLGAIAAGDSATVLEQLVSLLDPRLTPRERAVLTRILLGMTTAGIALDLGVKPSSIITFRRRAYTRLGIATQAELFSRCLRALPPSVAVQR